MNRGKFFDQIKTTVFGGEIDPAQISGIVAVLEEWDSSNRTDNSELSHALAVAFHHTDKTMLPAEDFGGKKHVARFDRKTGRAERETLERPNFIGTIEDTEKFRFRRRGMAPIEGRAEYEELGIAEMPDIACDLYHSTKLLFRSAGKVSKKAGTHLAKTADKFLEAIKAASS